MELNKLSIKELEDRIARGMTGDAIACFVELLKREEAKTIEALYQSTDPMLIYRHQGNLSRTKWLLKQLGA